MDIEVALIALEAEIEPLERFLGIFAASLNTPHMRRGDGDEDFSDTTIRMFAISAF